MVPEDSLQPPPPPRSLSPETIALLRTEIEERWRMTGDTDGRLTGALQRAALEARILGLRPEELIIAMRVIEDDVMGRPGALRAADPDARRRFREWVVTTCLKAYFSDGRAR